MKQKLLSLASTLLALAGLGHRRSSPGVTVTQVAPPVDQPKDRYRNRPVLPMLFSGGGSRPAPKIEGLRFSGDQRKRRKLNRQANPQGFKYRHC